MCPSLMGEDQSETSRPGQGSSTERYKISQTDTTMLKQTKEQKSKEQRQIPVESFATALTIVLNLA